MGCGRAWLNQHILIVDPVSLTPLTDSQVGEIWVSSPNVAKGYWQQPEATQENFQAHLSNTTEGTFLRTGDLGFLYKGELFVTGRLKEVIIVRGRNHYPQDIEFTVASSHPALQSRCGAAFVAEINDQERLIVTQEVQGPSLTPPEIDEIVGSIRQAVTQQHRLQVYAVLLLPPNTLIKTEGGKIKRQACRRAFLNQSLPAIAKSILAEANSEAIEDRLTRKILLAMPIAEWQHRLEVYLQFQLANVLDVDLLYIDLQRPLLQLGLDSLSTVKLRNRLEVDLGIGIPDTIFLENTNGNRLVTKLIAQLTDEAEEPRIPLLTQQVHHNWEANVV